MRNTHRSTLERDNGNQDVEHPNPEAEAMTNRELAERIVNSMIEHNVVFRWTKGGLVDLVVRVLESALPPRKETK